MKWPQYGSQQKLGMILIMILLCLQQFQFYSFIIKLFIIQACIITTCIDLFIEILVAPLIYMIQFSSDVLQNLVQELQDLFRLAAAILIMR